MNTNVETKGLPLHLREHAILGDFSTLAGRVLIAVIFFGSGFSKIPGFAATVGYIASKNVPFPELCAVASIALELTTASMVLFGWRARLGALALALFVLIITPIFHAPWNIATEPMKTMQLHALYKNVATIGGLLVLAGMGAGRFSFDARKGK